MTFKLAVVGILVLNTFALAGERTCYSVSGEKIACESLGSVRVTQSGHKFVRDGSNPILGDAWRAPNGVIWSETYVGRRHSHECEGRNAVLPTPEDFRRLKQYMLVPAAGNPSESNFVPQVLPQFSRIWIERYPADEEYREDAFWTDSLATGLHETQEGFDHLSGDLKLIDSTYYENGNRVAQNLIRPFKCIVRPKGYNPAAPVVCHSVNNEVIPCAEAETRKMTLSGAIYVRDARFPQLGEAWRDPRGVIWGDIIRRSNGAPVQAGSSFPDCWKFGARPANQRELDGLLSDMRVTRATGTTEYVPQILPGLRSVFWGYEGRHYRCINTWGIETSCLDIAYFDGVFGKINTHTVVFASGLGKTDQSSINDPGNIQARCVMSGY